MQLTTAVDRYLASRATRVAPNTLNADRSALRRLAAALGTREVDEITEDDLDQFFESEDHLAPSSLNMRLGKYRAFFSYALSRGWVPSNPAVERRRVREPEGDPLYIPVDRFPDLLRAAGHPRDRMVVALGLYLFLRSSEIKTLRVTDVRLREGVVRTFQHKTQTRDDMPICAELDTELRAWLAWYTAHCGPAGLGPGFYLVPAKHSVRSSPQAWPGNGRFVRLTEAKELVHPGFPVAHPHRVVQRALVGLGYPTLRQGGHTLRRSGARALFDQVRGVDGVDGALQTVRVMLHHQTQAMTERYLGIQPERERRDTRLRGRQMFTPRNEVTEIAAWR